MRLEYEASIPETASLLKAHTLPIHLPHLIVSRYSVGKHLLELEWYLCMAEAADALSEI